jgi:nitrogenase molybdenum-cofactor synthesis protein NifE
VLEVIGEDFEAVVFNIQDQVNAKLLVVHTEHFKCNSHIPGIERTLTALKDLMQEQAVVPGTVNILGHRYEGVEKTELLQLLKSKGITVNLVIPSSCGVDDLKSAPGAALNIVTDFTALPLADAMKIEYGTDYVYFDRYLSPMRIESAYNDISQKLNIDLSKEVSVLKDELNRVILEHSFSFSSKRFIYGNTPMLAFEVSGFLSSLGMEPILVQARDLYANDHKYMKEILDLGWDPYVSRIANIAPLQLLYGQLKPDIYVGHENPRRLAEQGITQVVLDSAASKLGFEVPSAVVRTIAKSLIASKSMDRRHGHRAAN